MSNFKIYQSLNQNEDVVFGANNTVSDGYFPGGQITFLQSLLRTDTDQKRLTGSNGAYDVLNGLYYTNVYDGVTSDKNLLFSISYGDADGGGVKSGSVFKNTQAVYSQHANLLLGIADEDNRFSFKTGSSATNTYITSSEVFVMAFSTNLMHDQIDKGQWSFSINGMSGSASLHLVDETPLLTAAEKKESRLVYQIISGSYDSDQNRNLAQGDYHGLGLFYPKNGMMVLNAPKIRQYCGLNYNEQSSSVSHVDNGVVLYNQMVAVSNRNMRVRKSEIVPSTHYYIRVKNKDFNFSNNPTFVYTESVSGSLKGEILDSIIDAPKTYVTTVGLYNETNELVAVAKLSNPTRKDFSNELLFKIRLDF